MARYQLIDWSKYDELIKEDELSNAEIARMIGCKGETVGSRRRKLYPSSRLVNEPNNKETVDYRLEVLPKAIAYDAHRRGVTIERWYELHAEGKI